LGTQDRLASSPMPRTFRVSQSVVTMFYPWIVLFGAFLLFQVGRGLADDIGPEPIVDTLVRADRILGLGELPSITLQRWQFDAVTVIAQAIHVTFFVLPIAIGLTLTALRKQVIFRRYAYSLAIAFALGFVVYAVAPTAPPWFANESIEMLLIPNQDRELRLRVDPNPFAAFPSMHMAVATISAGMVVGRYRWLAVAYPILMAWALAYLGEHYVVDALGGLALGCLSLGVTASRRVAYGRLRLRREMISICKKTE